MNNRMQLARLGILPGEFIIDRLKRGTRVTLRRELPGVANTEDIGICDGFDSHGLVYVVFGKDRVKLEPGELFPALEKD